MFGQIWWVLHQTEGNGVSKHIFVVQTNAVQGRDREYNDWLDAVHLPDALAVDGFSAVQRFKLSETQRPAAQPYPYRYLTIYEMDGPPDVALAAQAAAIPHMQLTSAMADLRMLHVFDAIGDRIVSPR